ncbi:hypothetical protein C8A03DRAFT_28859 [Achaetomium macrosporum]|uniref:Uncharacterized protein n=1 Tax=Achaetomium macrosporum TaxID=79813 RepID=A0AAN7CJC7_9PEZI|nr:hypothetical protein C8A03DRAFT_28859 [Achaetomium macrosporum]
MMEEHRRPSLFGEGSVPSPEERPSSSSAFAGGEIPGISSSPPARDSPRSPFSSTKSGSPSSSTLPDVASESDDREKKMEATNSVFFSHHHEQVVALMKKKFQNLLDYDNTKNRKILHVDWVAGNPNDPARKEGGESAASGGMSEEDRKLAESAARSVMRITHGVEQWDETKTWNKSMFFGDWLKDQNGFRQHYVEIQVKRISGADEALLEHCGISPELVWLPLYDENAPAIQPVTVPPIFATGARQLPTPREQARESIPEVEEVENAAPAPATSTQAPTSSADKGKGKAVAPQGQASVVKSASSGPPLPNIGNLALRKDGAAESSTTSAGPSAPRSGIPRSQALPTTGSFESIEAPESERANSPDSAYSDEVYLPEGVDPFATIIPAHRTRAISAADMARHREQWDRNTIAKREELDRLFSFHKDPAFIERKHKSFIYAVRIISIPDRGDIVNVFSGPPVKNRYGTLIASGGWVVPPLEERIKWRDEHKRAYRNKAAKLGRYEGLPRPTVQQAMPMKFDWSDGLDRRYYGPPAPIWCELCEPCLEDIYWMVWQLVAGKCFLGFNPGTGFGVLRRDPEGDKKLLSECPFKSPSAEALYHAASYPRHDETKRN